MFKLFKDIKDLEKEKQDLKAQVKNLKIEIEEKELKGRIAIEEVKHLNRLAQEKRDVELEKEKIKLEREFNSKTEKLQQKLHDELAGRFAIELTNLKQIYSDLITRLPNVNMEIKKRG